MKGRREVESGASGGAPQGLWALYLLIFGAALFFFLAGIWVGRFSAGDEAADPPTALIQPIETPSTELGLYDSLPEPKPEDHSSSPEAAQGTGSESPEPGAPQKAEVGPGALTPGPETSEQDLPGGKEKAAPVSSYTIQVAALNTRREAEQVVIRLEAKGYAAELAPPFRQDDPYFRVWVGSFPSAAEAKPLENQLKADGFPTYVKRVKR